VVALDGVDLRVERGEIYGFLGLNGAGKTTTIRSLLGMVRPSSGAVQVLGVRLGFHTQELWGRVGYLVDSATAYPELTVRENLDVSRRLLGLANGHAVDRAIDRLGLAEYASRRAATLSLGNLQRLGLARALLHEPDLLVLDEPANGLDPAGVVEIRELLRSLASERGTTVFMSSHVLTEIARLATRIGIVHRGRMLEELSAQELERRCHPRLEISVRDVEGARAALQRSGFAPELEDGQSRIVLGEPRAIERPDEIATLLVEQGVPPLRLAVEQEDIEQYFLRLTASAEQGR
jgi:ABC-2 type transport system ATP-binding protein